MQTAFTRAPPSVQRRNSRPWVHKMCYRARHSRRHASLSPACGDADGVFLTASCCADAVGAGASRDDMPTLKRGSMALIATFHVAFKVSAFEWWIRFLGTCWMFLIGYLDDSLYTSACPSYLCLGRLLVAWFDLLIVKWLREHHLA